VEEGAEGWMTKLEGQPEDLHVRLGGCVCQGLVHGAWCMGFEN
jgi:hypothetical protein